jgi:predicted nucleic acid-binding protein
MAVLFFDPSGLVKRYIAETGTSWVINQLKPSAANDIFIANIAGIEVASAIMRRVKSKSISQKSADKALKRFKRNFENKFIIVDLTPKIIEEGILLSQKYGLRGYDTAQLAVGLNVRNRLIKSGIRNFTFISADKELNIAAQSEGLSVDNPNNHP